MLPPSARVKQHKTYVLVPQQGFSHPNEHDGKAIFHLIAMFYKFLHSC